MGWRETIAETYPDAIPFSELHERSRTFLEGEGFTAENTLFANATCRDEVNKPSVELLGEYWGENFDLAGLAGFPSAGLTGFTAYSHHVPDGGYLFVLYGAHIGVGESAELGKVRRVGMRHETGSCGALVGFLGKLQADPAYRPADDPLDTEQRALEQALLPQRERILGAARPLLALTDVAYEVIDEQLEAIIAKNGYSGPIALLGGIEVNTPLGEEDWFVAQKAVLRAKASDPAGERSWLERLRA